MDDLISRQAAIDEIKKCRFIVDAIEKIRGLPSTADVRDYATAHKVVGGGERDGATCWFECDCCGLAVDIGDVFCKHCGARFVP